MNEDTRSLMVTIRCLTYNHEPYIRQCLDGFVMQKTNFRFEAIVHDDASTDGTAAIVKEYAEKYPDIIKPIFETENQYSKRDGSLRRIVNEHTHGKYIAYCEGDDYWIDPLKLQKQVDFLESHSDYSMCFHKAQILAIIDCKIGLNTDDIENREYFPNELFPTWRVPTAAIVARKEVLEIINKRRERILNGDIVLVLNCVKVGKIYGMSDIMSVYRVHSSGVTYDRKTQHSRIMQYPEHFRFIKDNYPFINRNMINHYIARAYLNRRKEQQSFYLWIMDVLKAIWFYPPVLLDKINGGLNRE